MVGHLACEIKAAEAADSHFIHLFDQIRSDHYFFLNYFKSFFIMNWQHVEGEHACIHFYLA